MRKLKGCIFKIFAYLGERNEETKYTGNGWSASVENER